MNVTPLDQCTEQNRGIAYTEDLYTKVRVCNWPNLIQTRLQKVGSTLSREMFVSKIIKPDKAKITEQMKLFTQNVVKVWFKNDGFVVLWGWSTYSESGLFLSLKQDWLIQFLCLNALPLFRVVYQNSFIDKYCSIILSAQRINLKILQTIQTNISVSMHFSESTFFIFKKNENLWIYEMIL